MVNPFTATRGGIFKGGSGPSKGDSRQDAAGKGASQGESRRDSVRQDSGEGAGPFQEALKRGSAYAWKGRWAEAVDEYRLALQHSPRDPSARTYLAMALHKSGQMQEALDLYQELWTEQPSNPSMLQRIAEVQAGMGDPESAVASYQKLADVHTRRRAPKDAFQAWKMVAALKPNDLALWDSVLEAGVKVGAVTEVVPSYLKLARGLALEGRFEEAVGVVERGQRVDPDNPLMLPLLAAIRGALAYSWRARALGGVPTSEELARLIPEISLLVDTAFAETARPSASPPPEDVAPIQQDSAAAKEEETTEASVEQPTGETAQPVTELDETLAPALEPPVDTVPGWMDEELDLSGPAPQDEPVLVSPLQDEESESSSPAPVEGLEEDLVTQEPQSESSEAGLLEDLPEPEPQPECAEPEMEEVLEGPFQAIDSVDVVVPEETDEPLAETEREPEVCEDPAEMSTVVAEEPGLPEEQDELLGEPDEPIAESDLQEEPAAETDLQEEPTVADVEETVESSEAVEASAGTAIAEQLAELAEAHEQSGQVEQAAEAYAQALELSPRLPRALLGMARLHLAAGDLDLAEGETRQILEYTVSEGSAVVAQAARLLLDVLIGRVVSGDLQSATEGLLWLRATVPVESLPAEDVESETATLAGLLGECGTEHLEELGQLPPEVRGEVVLALKKSEELLRDGAFRSATDEIYRLIVDQPDFLPAQSLLVRALAAQNRLEAARDRSQRLVDLYDMRGAPAHALDILKWRVSEGIGNGDDRARLVQLLRTQNRLTEAEAIETGGRRDGGD